MPSARVRALHEQEYDLLPEMFPGVTVQHPGFRPGLCRVLTMNGRIVAAVLIERRTLRYGGADLRAGLVRGFDTGGDPRHQHDHFAALMRDTLARLAEQGAHVALLRVHHESAVPGPDFGFVPVWPQTIFTCESAAAAEIIPPDDLHLRAIRPHDVPAVAALYEQHFGAHVTLTRPPQTWLWRVATQTPPALVVAGEQAAQLHGYIAGNDLLSEAVEIAVDTPEAARLLLADAGKHACNAGLDALHWTVAPDSVLVAFARQMLDVTLSAHYPRRGGWMARLIDARRLVETLLPELSAHLQQTQQAAPLHISAHADFIRVQSQAVTDIAHTDFIQLLFGALTPAALGIKARLKPDAVRLLAGVFPPRVAGIGVWDW